MTAREGERKTRGEQEQLERFVELLSTYATEALTARLLDQATGGELTPAQLDALVFLQRHGGCSAKALSEGLNISIPSATRLVDRMVRKALVDRRESGADRRLVQLTVTPAGESALARVRQARVQSLRQTLETFAPEERERLLSLLERFLLAALRDEQTVKDCCRHCGTEHDLSCVVNEAYQALVGHAIESP